MNKRRFRTENIGIEQIGMALVVWIVIGLIGSFLINLVISIGALISIIFAIIIAVSGLKWDTLSINANETVGSYNGITKAPLKNYQGGGILWRCLGLRTFGFIYDRTDNVKTLSLEKSTTFDKNPRQFVSLKADIVSYIIDPLAYEINAGTDDAEDQIRKKQLDEIQQWIRRKTLNELENEENVTINDNGDEDVDSNNLTPRSNEPSNQKSEFREMKEFMENYGVALNQPIRVRDITSTSDRSREALASLHYEEQLEDIKQMKFSGRVNKNYLSHLARMIDGKDDIFFLKKAKEELEQEASGEQENIHEKVTEYHISVRAIALAERYVDDKKYRRKLYEMCLVQEQNRQGIVPKTQTEVLGGKGNDTLPILNIGKNK